MTHRNVIVSAVACGCRLLLAACTSQIPWSAVAQTSGAIPRSQDAHIQRSTGRRASPLTIEHTVTVRDPSRQLFELTSRFGNVSQPTLTLSLPTWSPGWYTIENYAKNMLRLTITDSAGHPLAYRMTRKQTWEVNTRGTSEVRVKFDYTATLMGLDQAKITATFAYFTGTELFLEPVGHRREPETVKFVVPAGWRILSPLRATTDSTVFVADNYDQLVDAPAELGHFDVTRYSVDGTPHYLVVTPPGTYTAAEYAKVTPSLANVIHSEAKVFGGEPYGKYVAFYFFVPAETPASGGLEHLNSHVALLSKGAIEAILPLFAHESFHAWNVKRLRPAEMWPYDYSRENETPLLWVSEGFTDYYALLSRLRSGAVNDSGIVNDSVFLAETAQTIGDFEGNNAREYKPIADASTSTWLGYDTHQAFEVDYYAGGHIIATLLDVLIRSDTNGARGLDDAFRWLWNNSYKKGRGFTTADVVTALNTVSGRNYGDFIRSYVQGTKVPPYDSIFGRAGYRLEMKRDTITFLGYDPGDSTAEGLPVSAVVPGGPLARAGVHEGDMLVSINGASPFGSLPVELAGRDVPVVITRNGRRQTFTVTVGARDGFAVRFLDVASPTPDQLAIRRAWLKKD